VREPVPRPSPPRLQRRLRHAGASGAARLRAHRTRAGRRLPPRGVTGGAARPRPGGAAARERRTLPLVVWKRGLGRELLEVPPVPDSRRPRSTSARPGDRRGAGRDRRPDRPHRRRHRARHGFGDGGSRCRRAAGDRHLVRRARRRPRPSPRSSQPRPNGDPAGVGGMSESLIISFVLIGISVSKGAHRPVERVPGAEIAADRDRVA
jgi:hypothetical protein